MLIILIHYVFSGGTTITAMGNQMQYIQNPEFFVDLGNNKKVIGVRVGMSRSFTVIFPKTCDIAAMAINFELKILAVR